METKLRWSPCRPMLSSVSSSSPPHPRPRRLLQPVESSPRLQSIMAASPPFPSRIVLFLSALVLLFFGALSLRSALSLRDTDTDNKSISRARFTRHTHPDGKYCRNERTHWLTVDSRAVVCESTAVDEVSGCCVGKDARYLPWKCATMCTRSCCTDYAMCVSCCLTRGKYRRKLPLRITKSHIVTMGAFDVCTFNCRTNSDSVIHENAYKSIYRFCWGKESPPVNENLHRGLFDFAQPQKRNLKSLFD